MATYFVMCGSKENISGSVNNIFGGPYDLETAKAVRDVCIDEFLKTLTDLDSSDIEKVKDLFYVADSQTRRPV